MPWWHYNATRLEQVTELPVLLLYSLAPLAEARQSEYRLSSPLLNENAPQAPWPAVSFWMNTFGLAFLVKAGLRRLN